MTVAARVFRGYGNGTVVGTVDDRVHRGYTSAAAVTPVNISCYTYEYGKKDAIPKYYKKIAVGKYSCQ